MESLSAYARQFLDQLSKPDVDEIEGLPPTIAIEQRSAARSPRSTVATATEIYDYLRLLFARVAQPCCWEPTKRTKAGKVTARCGRPIASTHPSQIAASVSALPEGTRLLVLAPVVRGKKGFHRDAMEQLAKDGFVRARVNGEIVSIGDALSEEGENPLGLKRHAQHDIEVGVDRLTVRDGVRQRLADSVETALGTAAGTVVVAVEEGEGFRETTYSEHHACTLHPMCSLPELEPRLFSFNSPHGACARCHGLGILLEYDEDLILPDHDRSLASGGIAPWSKGGPAAGFGGRFVRRFCRRFGITGGTKVADLSEELRTVMLHGGDKEAIKRVGGKGKWGGVIPQLTGWMERTESESVKEFLQGFMSESGCPTCHGSRLSEGALSVFLESEEPLPDDALLGHKSLALGGDGHRFNITDLTHLSIGDASRVLGALRLSPERRSISDTIVREVSARLAFLGSVGLDYLSLDRATSTLSGGEAQRIRLATQVGSGIVGAAYVLDEPTIGLHPRDNSRLIRTLRRLTDIGNTVVVVEHDEEMIRAADHVIDMGPGPGVHGGRVVAQGRVEDVEASEASLTGHYLAGRKEVETPQKRRSLEKSRSITIRGARANNLKSIDAIFPLGGLICVTGVSGSGKSTLVNEILLKAARRHVNKARVKPGAHTKITGMGAVDRIVDVDQSPIGRTPRSNAATYTGLFDDVRKIFSQTQLARMRGYGPGRFSFNVKGGRCEMCQGQGQKRISMHFLPDVYVTCEVCSGSRYAQETLEVTYRGKSIADVLAMSIEEAQAFFENHPRIRRVMDCLVDVGLSYVELGQPSTTLSGGEAQRVKLATELWKGAGTRGSPGHALFILDEPTTGLHFEDVRKLVMVLQRLADQGNSVVVIEHNLDVIKTADWILDLGPEGGDGGGTIVAEGPPERVARVKKSHTAGYLRALL